MKSKTLFEKSITLMAELIHAYLIRKGYDISSLTVHKYMNTEMQLFSISRKKKPVYEHGVAHKVYENKLNQDFHANAINPKWCTDFTYLFLTDGSKRYNCTIIDLHDRSVISSITDKNITADLAIRTLEKAIHSQSKNLRMYNITMSVRILIIITKRLMRHATGLRKPCGRNQVVVLQKSLTTTLEGEKLRMWL